GATKTEQVTTLGGEPEHQRLTHHPGALGTPQSTCVVVQPGLVLGAEPVPGVVVGTTHRRIETGTHTVHQFVHQHRHEHRLADLARPHQRDRPAADPTKTHRQL